ncbi:MAG: hypothetical protein RLZZ200_2755 [Pseudomonadota bacterium]|jgi:cytochrome P450
MNAIPASLCSDIDLFADGLIDNPYPAFKALRDLGPAAYLSRHDSWFLGRHAQVRAALGDWASFSSAQGIGLNAIINEAWKTALICLDPPEHTKAKVLLTERLSPRALKPVEDVIDRMAADMADRVVAAGHFDGITDVAHELPLNLIMDLIGWPERVRATLRGMAEGAFEVCGPMDNSRMQASLPRLQSMMQLIAEVYDRNELVPGGFGSTIADSARRGEIAREDAIGLLAGYVVAAFDTTISGIGSGLWLFATNPDQWDIVRRDPALIPRAFNEILRMETPIQYFGRVTTRDVDVGERVTIPAGSRVVVSYAAANRDERHFPDPDRFDIRRSPSDHLAFGHGNHSCAGQGLARMEAHAVFRALAAKASRLALDGAPRLGRTAFTRGLEHLPLRASP